jgi:hypothetical protein
MRRRLAFVSIAVALVLAACHEGRVARSPAPSASPPAAVVSVAAVADAGGPPSAPSPVASADVYVGAVGSLPVRATVTVTPSRLSGRWVYEGRGSAAGLALEGAVTTTRGTYAVRETDAGEASGEFVLSVRGARLEGTWSKPDGSRSTPVFLTKEIRAREGENVVRARRIFVVRHAGPPKEALPGFLPVVEGPAGAPMMRHLTVEALTGDEERDFGEGTTEVDFEVVHHDARVLTLATTVSTLGAYPSSHVPFHRADHGFAPHTAPPRSCA